MDNDVVSEKPVPASTPAGAEAHPFIFEPPEPPEPPDEPQEAEESGTFSGVHDVQKSVDYWFEREVNEIEREADRLASDWADENLPTLTESGAEVLPPEQMLESRCGELWQRWPTRSEVKTQDAIDASAAEISARLGLARGAVLELQVTNEQLRDSEQKIEDIRQQMATNPGPVRYKSYMTPRSATLFATLLVTVEFIANQPVFRIIWPISAEVDSAMKDYIARAAQSGWSAGIKTAALEVLSYVEGTVLALVVVGLLYVLSKNLGKALRPLYAMRAADYPFASRSIESLHRQKRFLVWSCGIGTVAVLGFLYSSRGSASELVTRRIDSVEKQLRALGAREDSLLIQGEMPSESDDLRKGTLQATISQLEEVQFFADTIESNNNGILILNISLVCCALIVGYMSDEHDISDTMGEHPDMPRLKEKCVTLRESTLRRSVEARDQIARGELASQRLQSLLRARPLATNEAKRRRLESIIPRWRSTNARIRGLHPESIASFRRATVLDLPPLPLALDLVRPEGVDALVAELRTLAAAVYSGSAPLARSEPVAA